MLVNRSLIYFVFLYAGQVVHRPIGVCLLEMAACGFILWVIGNKKNIFQLQFSGHSEF